jgi:glycosyltransferase involved in cell wall biosynthesis
MLSVSIIIVTYNREKLLIKAIDSVLNQKFSDFELIIIDDFSTDNTEDAVKKYLADKKVKYIKIAKSKFISQVRNSAWPYVSGKYVAVLDSDDVWFDENKLSKQVEFLDNNPEVVLVGSGAILIDSEGREIETVNKPERDSDIRKDFFSKNPFFHSSVLYRYDAIKQVGGYDTTIRFGEDLDLWLRLGKVGQLYNFPEAFIKYRVHSDNEANKHRANAIIDVLRIIKKNRKHYGAGPLMFLKKIFGKMREMKKR